MDGNNPEQPEPVQISSASFAAKYRSKREIYNFLSKYSQHTRNLLFFIASECKKYLPPLESCTIFWLKDIVAGQKRALDGHLITFQACPQYETLFTPLLLQWARQQNSDLFSYLPIEKEIIHLPKQFVVNMIFRSIGHPFSQFI